MNGIISARNVDLALSSSRFSFFSILLVYIFTASLFSAGNPMDPYPILDMHCHTAGTGAGGSGCFVSAELKAGYKFSIYLKAFNVTREELALHGDRLVIKRLSEELDRSKQVSDAIVLALDGVVDSSGQLDSAMTQVFIPNDFLARETAKYPNLHFGASINPYRPDAPERLSECADKGAQLVKWIPSIQYIDPSNSSIIGFYEKMKELNLPLLSHTGNERSFSHSEDKFCDPGLLKLPLSLGVTVIAAHVATTGHYEGQPSHERLISMFTAYPNLYADISSLTQINKKKYLDGILSKKDIHSRLIYGTDIPLINTVLVSPLYYPVKLPWKEIRRLRKIENMWDRDVELKRALGVPEEMFRNGNRLFPLCRPDSVK
jgi:predicted TIM-barrel fold metal-dependent hydrolase